MDEEAEAVAAGGAHPNGEADGDASELSKQLGGLSVTDGADGGDVTSKDAGGEGVTTGDADGEDRPTSPSNGHKPSEQNGPEDKPVDQTASAAPRNKKEKPESGNQTAVTASKSNEEPESAASGQDKEPKPVAAQRKKQKKSEPSDQTTPAALEDEKAESAAARRKEKAKSADVASKDEKTEPVATAVAAGKDEPAAARRKEKAKSAAAQRDKKPEPAADRRNDEPKSAPAAAQQDERPESALTRQKEKPEPAAVPRDKKPEPVAARKDSNAELAAKRRENEKPEPAAKGRDGEPEPAGRPAVTRRDSEPDPAAVQDDEADPAADVGPLTYRWQLVDTDEPAAADPQLEPLVFSQELLTREMTNKKWRPQGVTKKLMEAYHVYQIKKPPSHHKNAKYVCRVCELHWDTLLAVQKHVGDQRHKDNTRRHQELTAVSALPEPTAAQVSRLTDLLNAVFEDHGLTNERLWPRCFEAMRDMQITVCDGLKRAGDECRLECYGSSRTGCGFTDSTVDVALLPADESRGAAQLTRAIQLLNDSPHFSDVEHDFQSWTPHVRCVHVATRLRCQLALGAERDVQLAHLIALYKERDERVAPLAVALRNLARICEMDRPHAGSLPPSAFVLMTVYYLQQCEPPVLPAVHQMVGGSALDDEPKLDLEAAREAIKDWRSENKSELGALWLRMLRFYALDLLESDAVVSIRQRDIVTRADKGWNKKISIEDPIQCKRNISRSISSGAVADLIVERLRAACLLFGVPRTAAGPAVRLVAGRSPSSEADAARLAEKLAAFTKDQLEYSFDKQLLCGETSMPVVCSVCQKTGHLADDCPTLVVPPAQQMADPPDQQVQLMDRICTAVFSDWAPPAHEYQIRQSMLRNIESFIRHQTFPSARLTLFGSSCNGFGFRNSDLDICMTFDDCTDPQSLDQPEIILRLAQTLNRLRAVCNVIPISTAKVPIVKFTDRRSRLEADISLYNTLAQHNTLLLHTYAMVDNRVRILGYMVKLMAKICDICDASRGSLSSYAYTLLLIYYLQRCRPAVLPVLQELDASSRRPHLVDGADVSFFTDLDRLRQHWPEAGRNTASVGELWLGFLRFYGEHFDFERNVVCIRRREVLTKFEKLWNGTFIAIEDPFLLSHNLGGGVRKKMASFIRRTLLLWRVHHLRPLPNTLPRGYRDFRAYLMSGDYLCEGPPPSSSGCHSCGRIGHWAADCPRRARRRPPPNSAADEPTHQMPERRPPEPVREPPRQEVGHAPQQAPVVEPARPLVPVSAPARAPGPIQAPIRPPMSVPEPVRAPMSVPDPFRAPSQGQYPASVRNPAPFPEPDRSAAQLLALLGGGCSAPGPVEPAGPRRVHGVHMAESLERQATAPRPQPPPQQQQPQQHPLGPPPGLAAPPGLAPPDLAHQLLAQLRQPAPWPGLAPPPTATLWSQPWPGGAQWR